MVELLYRIGMVEDIIDEHDENLIEIMWQILEWEGKNTTTVVGLCYFLLATYGIQSVN